MVNCPVDVLYDAASVATDVPMRIICFNHPKSNWSKPMSFNEQQEKFRSATGFVAALDQSGGSTPKALALYGIGEDTYEGEQEMYEQVHAMRTRIMTNAAFTGDRIIAAILFEDTMQRFVEGKSTSDYLWQVKHVIPILKIDKGLEAETDGVQVMKPMPALGETLALAGQHGIFGTKMRSVIKTANAAGIERVVDQQFSVARLVIAAGMVPIIEPEVDVNSAQKSECEEILRTALTAHLERLDEALPVVFKLTLPNEDNYYRTLIDHDKVLRVVALSGGYTRADACEKLSRNQGMIASFSRALTEGLNAGMSDAEFTGALEQSIATIDTASRT